MGTVGKPRPAKLFSGLLTSKPELCDEVEKRLSMLFGPIDLKSNSFPFDSTHYYDEAMGSPLIRRFFSFARLVDPSGIANAKILTNQVEADLAEKNVGVLRPINLDPGYLEESKIVLASTKNFYHRILVSEGIYAEVTMYYERGDWHFLPWTFPDFRTGRYHPFFSELRNLYRKQINAAKS